MELKPVIGLEIHVELDLSSKLFCRCKNDTMSDKANTNICSYCAAFPHIQPNLNTNAVILGLKAATLLQCEINEISSFDKKQYFYPDLPKGFQTTQYFNPLAVKGKYSYIFDDTIKTIEIKQVHIEEDAAKLIYQNNQTIIDYNRSGIALLEIVTLPQFNNVLEVDTFLNWLIADLKRNNITEGKLENGNIRVDVNISLEKGNRTEIKNLNSLKSIRNSISLEIDRQKDIISSSNIVTPSVLKYDDKTNKIFVMRRKETSLEYRYIPESDILPIKVSKNIVSRLRETIKILYNDIKLLIDMGLSCKDSFNICTDTNIFRLFNESISVCNNPVTVKNYLLQEVRKATNNLNIGIQNLTGAKLIGLMSNENLSQQSKRIVLKEILLNDINPKTYIETNNLSLITDEAILNNYIDIVLVKYNTVDFNNNSEKKLQFILGQVNILSGFKADMKIVAKLVEKRI